MDLSTSYMGISLKHPLVPSSSPLTRELSSLRQLEDAGASAVVMYSLFEEQLEFESKELDHFLQYGAESYAEAMTYLPEPHEFHRGPEEYLEHIRQAKQALEIPVIASLNGSTPGGWIDYSRRIQEAGADGLELNVFFLPTDPTQTVGDVEKTYLDIVSEVKRAVSIPVAVKMHPFFTSIPGMAKRLESAGADGLVLFNRFYQPDIDPENLEVQPNLQLSTPYESRLAMRWLGILYGRVGCDLAATGGVHGGRDAVKLLMTGASVVHLCSALLKYGIYHLRRIKEEMTAWMEENECLSTKALIGSMSQKNCPDPRAFERANYIKTLHSYV